MDSTKVEYVGKDLEAMDFAVGYHRWILDLMRPYLGRDIVEVGAGTGSFSELILTTSPRSLTMVEPSRMFDSLKANVSSIGGDTELHFCNDIFSTVADRIRGEVQPDSMIYVNVLEHIDDDIAELKLVHDTLRPGGRVFIFVPALPMLYSEFDKYIGHFRRYRKRELRSKLTSAGFRIEVLRWFDFPGIIPWLIKYRLARSTTMERSAVQLYDKVAVPLIRPLENLINPPVGKNLLAIAERI